MAETLPDDASVWAAIRCAPLALRPAPAPPFIPASDRDEAPPQSDDHPPTWPLASISGLNLFITYTDSQGFVSERRIACRRLERRADRLYLIALCLECLEPRRFRCDRIATIVDMVTGEVHETSLDFLASFQPDRTSASPFNYGLSVDAYNDFNAALNVLAFMARCDGQWHELEVDAIEAFATSYWLRRELTAELDLAEIDRHLARLSPDPETFWLALQRCRRSKVIASILRRHIAAVVDSDGIHHPAERYWGEQVDALLARPIDTAKQEDGRGLEIRIKTTRTPDVS